MLSTRRETWVQGWRMRCFLLRTRAVPIGAMHRFRCWGRWQEGRWRAGCFAFSQCPSRLRCRNRNSCSQRSPPYSKPPMDSVFSGNYAKQSVLVSHNGLYPKCLSLRGLQDSVEISSITRPEYTLFRRGQKSMRAETASSTLNTTELLNALVSFKNGNFSVRLPADRTGVGGKVYDALNEIFQQNEQMTVEFARVSNAVGKEGKITQRAAITAKGGYTACVESVNSLISDLVQPSTEVARVIGAVAKGDLTQTMALEVEGRSLKGEFLHTARVVNTMVDQLNSFASEVTRVAKEVGTEGKLGGQAEVLGVAGTWKDLTDSVNYMASNLTNQVRNIAGVTTAVAKGDLTTKITVDARGEILELKNTINTMVDQLSSFASEVARVARGVGTEGELGGQADVKGVGGVWKDLTDSVNSMAGNLTAQVRNIAEVTTAVANGDLSRKITVDVRGEILELKNTINVMVDQLNAFASEVTRVAREVGTEGKLGGQAEVKGVAGTWKDLTDSVNSMASNLTNQVRNIAEVTTAVARGDLSRKITVDVLGEIAELADTINGMIDTLAT